MNKNIFIALLFLLLTFHSKAEDSTFTIKKKFDTTFIQSYKEYLTLGIFTLSPADFLTINTFSPSNNKEYNYTTNIAASIGFTAAYRSIYVAFAFKTALDAQSIETYGKSRFNGFGIKVNNRKFNIAFESGKVKGFYNSDVTYKDSSNSNKYLTRGDIEIKRYAFNGVYNFNHKKYSILAPSNQTERQIKSKVGFLLKASISKNLITSDSSVTNTSSNYEPTTFNRLAFTSFKVGPGIGINLIFIKRFYLSFIFYLSSNLVYYNYSGEGTEKIKGHAFTSFIEGRTAIGYQSKRFYIGINFNIDRIVFKNEHLKIENVTQIGSFTIGYRFPAPNVLKKVYKATLTRYLGL
jgi:hypothetical protein